MKISGHDIELDGAVSAAISGCVLPLGEASFGDLINQASAILRGESRTVAPNTVPSIAQIGAESYVSPVELNLVYGEQSPDYDATRRSARSNVETPSLVKLQLDKLSSRDLRRLRRRLAAEYHPDRAGRFERLAATRHMSQINQAIDKAIEDAIAREKAKA